MSGRELPADWDPAPWDLEGGRPVDAWCALAFWLLLAAWLLLMALGLGWAT